MRGTKGKVRSDDGRERRERGKMVNEKRENSPGQEEKTDLMRGEERRGR